MVAGCGFLLLWKIPQDGPLIALRFQLGHWDLEEFMIQSTSSTPRVYILTEIITDNDFLIVSDSEEICIKNVWKKIL